MKRRLCPQCKIPNFYVLNEKKERRLVFVTVEFEVIAAKEGESLEGFDLTVIIVWDVPGAVHLVVRYVIEYKMV